MKKLYVGNLPFSTTDEELGDIFRAFGTVTSIAIVKDRDDGRSKGFGFIEMESDDAADRAIAELDGSSFSGRNLKVSEARPSAPRPRRFRG